MHTILIELVTINVDELHLPAIDETPVLDLPHPENLMAFPIGI